MLENQIIVNDTMQTNYRYVCVARPGHDYPEIFKPELTPKIMLQLGVFGGKYLRDCREEFPADWFATARLASGAYDANLNFFKVRASQSLRTWQNKGWIHHKHDPRGWFQWYCRYYLGRRVLGYDQHQIKRWRNMRRHKTQIIKNCPAADHGCRPRQRQALLHWAYDARKI